MNRRGKQFEPKPSTDEKGNDREADTPILALNCA